MLTGFFGEQTPKGDCECTSSQLLQLHSELAAGLLWIGVPCGYFSACIPRWSSSQSRRLRMCGCITLVPVWGTHLVIFRTSHSCGGELRRAGKWWRNLRDPGSCPLAEQWQCRFSCVSKTQEVLCCLVSDMSSLAVRVSAGKPASEPRCVYDVSVHQCSRRLQLHRSRLGQAQLSDVFCGSAELSVRSSLRTWYKCWSLALSTLPEIDSVLSTAHWTLPQWHESGGTPGKETYRKSWNSFSYRADW